MTSSKPCRHSDPGCKCSLRAPLQPWAESHSTCTVSPATKPCHPKCKYKRIRPRFRGKVIPVRPSLKEILFLAIPVPHDAPIAPGCTAARATTVLPRQTHDARSANFTTSAGRADIASRNRDRKVRAGELGCLCTQGTRPPVRCRAKPSQQMVNMQRHATFHPEAREVVGAEDNKPGSS